MYTPILLDRTRNLRYGMKALNLIEKKVGKSISKIDLDNLTMEDTANVLWAGLVHEDKELTPDMVIDLIDEHSDLTTAITAMAQAFQDSFGKSNGKK